MPAWVGHSVASISLSVCLFVRALTGKRLELSTPNLLHLYSVAVARHALSKGQGHMDTKTFVVARLLNDHVSYFAYQYAAVLPAVVAVVCLHFDTTAYVF